MQRIRGKELVVEWQRQLSDIVQANSLIPTFEQWLDMTGNREYVRGISAGPVNLQATALNSLYDYYRTEMRLRFP